MIKARCVVPSILLLIPLSACVAESEAVTTKGSVQVAHRSDGAELWRVMRTTLNADPRSVINSRGHVKLHQGLGSETTPDSYTTDTQSTHWSPIEPLTTIPNFSYTKPIFDLAGNALLIVEDTTVRSIQSNGTSGTWQTPQIIPGYVPDESIPTPAIALDRTNGIVHAVYRTLDENGNNFVNWTFHMPGGSWAAPQPVFSSPNTFQDISLVVDSVGDAIAVFDLENAEGRPSAWSIVYSKGTGTWGAAQQISSLGEVAYAQTLASSDNGSFVNVVYLVVGTGIRFLTFSVPTGTWGTPSTIPGTSAANAQIVAVGTRYPFAIDLKGNATLVAPLYADRDQYYKLEGFHYQSGSWSPGATLLPLDIERNDGDILNTGSVAIDRTGNVLVVAPAYAPPNLNYDVFRYQPASGWDVELAAQTTSNSSVSDVGVAWFETGGQAAVSYSATGPLSSSVYANGAWSALSITGIRRYPGASSLTTSPLGSVLLTVDGFDTPAGIGLLVAWLRP